MELIVPNVDVKSEIDPMTDSTRPPRPPAPRFDYIPEELKLQDRWLCWSYSRRPNSKGEFNLIAHGRAGKAVRQSDQREWLSFADVRQLFETGRFNGVGFIGGDGLVCLEERQMDFQTFEQIRELRTYAERNLSGDGCQAIAFATLPKGRCAHGTQRIHTKRVLVPLTGLQLCGVTNHVERRENPMRYWYDRILLRVAN